jgi:hypothetical protein
VLDDITKVKISAIFNNAIHTSARFILKTALRLQGKFMILNKMTRPFSYPSHRLRAIFKLMMDWIIAESNALGYKPRHFIIGFDSELMDHQVHFNLHDLNPDIADIILHKFEKIDQSGMIKHKKESITTQEFEIDITAMDLGEEGQQKQGVTTRITGKRQRIFAGSGRRKLTAKVPYNVSPDACLELQNKDAFCLFRSFELLRRRATMKRQTFSDYNKNEERLQKDLEKLLLATGIPKDLAAYDIREFGQKIQDYYNDLHKKKLLNKKFRLFAFTTIGDFVPFWKSDAADYDEELSVLFTEGQDKEPGHYMPVASPGRLFGDAKVYCFSVYTYTIYFSFNLHHTFSARCHTSSSLNTIGIADTNAENVHR